MTPGEAHHAYQVLLSVGVSLKVQGSSSRTAPVAIVHGITFPFKRNATLGLGVSLTPILGQRPHGVKKLLDLTTLCPYGVIDPKFGS